MTPEQAKQLFADNANQLDQLDVDAGSLVKALLLELTRPSRSTSIRLRNPAPGGHTIDYEVVEGNPAVVTTVARLLGFKSAANSTLEVFSA